MFRFTGITKQTFSREGVALDGEVTTVRVDGPAEVLVVSMGANQQEINEMAFLIYGSRDLLNTLVTLADVAESRGIPVDAARFAIAKARGQA